MPVVIVHMYAGRDKEAKRRIAEGITKVFEAEKIPKSAITIIMNEVNKDNWCCAGALASD